MSDKPPYQIWLTVFDIIQQKLVILTQMSAYETLKEAKEKVATIFDILESHTALMNACKAALEIPDKDHKEFMLKVAETIRLSQAALALTKKGK